MTPGELTCVLTSNWRRLGLALDDADFTDAQAIASIARISGGNFRLLHRLLVQIGRILSSMLVGYMRISTTGERQSVDLQRDALLASRLMHGQLAA